MRASFDGYSRSVSSIGCASLAETGNGEVKRETYRSKLLISILVPSKESLYSSFRKQEKGALPMSTVQGYALPYDRACEVMLYRQNKGVLKRAMRTGLGLVQVVL